MIASPALPCEGLRVDAGVQPERRILASRSTACDYDSVHRHILDMAETLSAGIMRPVPATLH